MGARIDHIGAGRGPGSGEKAGSATSLVFRVALVGLVLSCSLAERQSETRLPVPERVVLVTLDTLRTDHLSAYGYFRETSPFLRRLAKRGILFENAFSPIPVTAPSHSSIFTGLNPYHHGVLGNRGLLDPELLTMARMFRQSGYQTAGFVATGFLKSFRPDFDFFHVNEKGGYRPAAEIIDFVLDWLSGKGPTDRFFLWVHLFDAHQWRTPYDHSPAYLERLAFESEREERRFLAFVEREHGLPRAWGGFKIDAIENYDAQILFADEQLKRLFDALEERGMNDDALWIVTSDHGEGLWSHGYIYHSKFLYEEELRVPLILYAGSGKRTGRRISELVRLIDLMPTLADLIGAKGPHDFEGQSLLPLIEKGVERPAPRYAFSQRAPNGRGHKDFDENQLYAIQDRRFKYIYHSEGDSEFFDLRKDPLETRNLIAEPSREKERLRAVLEDRHLVEMNAQSASERRVTKDPEVLEQLRDLGYLN